MASLYLNKNLTLEGSCSLRDADFILMGAPFDCTSTYRSGSRFAPLEIRKELLELEKEKGGKSFFDLKFHDAGNVDVICGNAGKTLGIVEETVGDILKENSKAKIITLGGEHLITLPMVKKISEIKKLSVVSLDAHLDLKDDYVGEKLSHSTVMRRISELGVNVIEMGVRTYDNNELDYAKKNVKFCGTDEVDIGKILAWIKGDVYLSIDMDVLDPAFAPGVGNPEPGGMAFNYLQGIIRTLGRRIIALDITEVCPPYDQSGMTSVAGARLLLDYLLK